jgi:hypothetical protein
LAGPLGFTDHGATAVGTLTRFAPGGMALLALSVGRAEFARRFGQVVAAFAAFTGKLSQRYSAFLQVVVAGARAFGFLVARSDRVGAHLDTIACVAPAISGRIFQPLAAGLKAIAAGLMRAGTFLGVSIGARRANGGAFVGAGSSAAISDLVADRLGAGAAGGATFAGAGAVGPHAIVGACAFGAPTAGSFARALFGAATTRPAATELCFGKRCQNHGSREEDRRGVNQVPFSHYHHLFFSVFVSVPWIQPAGQGSVWWEIFP